MDVGLKQVDSLVQDLEGGLILPEFFWQYPDWAISRQRLHRNEWLKWGGNPCASTFVGVHVVGLGSPWL